MSEWQVPIFDHTSSSWFVREVESQSGRVLSEYDFHEEEEALNFFLQSDIRQERLRGLI